MSFTSLPPAISPETLSHVWMGIVGGVSTMWLIWLWGVLRTKIAAGSLLIITGMLAFLFHLVPIYQWLPTITSGTFLVIIGCIQLPDNDEAKK